MLVRYVEIYYVMNCLYMVKRVVKRNKHLLYAYYAFVILHELDNKH